MVIQYLVCTQTYVKWFDEAGENKETIQAEQLIESTKRPKRTIKKYK